MQKLVSLTLCIIILVFSQPVDDLLKFLHKHTHSSVPKGVFLKGKLGLLSQFNYIILEPVQEPTVIDCYLVTHLL